MFCTSCGAPTSANARFCPACGSATSHGGATPGAARTAHNVDAGGVDTGTTRTGMDFAAGTFERLQALDADIVQEPTDQPYGVRDCAVRDPAGNMIRIQQLR